MNRDAWLAERRTGIGASDSAPICGLSPWRSAFEVYLEKTGDLPPQEMSAPMHWGLKAEPMIAEAYEEATGRRLEQPDGIIRHPDYPYLLATLDRVSADDGRIVELKTAGAFALGEWGEAGTDQVPDHYAVQVQHQMLVADRPEADLAVLIGGNDFRIYHLARSQTIIDRIIEIDGAFWQRVQRRDPPEPDWSHPRTLGLMKALYGVDETNQITLGADAEHALGDFETARRAIKEAEAERDQAKARLLHLMGSASYAALPDGTALTRKQITRKSYIVGECTYTDLRIKAPRGAKR